MLDAAAAADVAVAAEMSPAQLAKNLPAVHTVLCQFGWQFERRPEGQRWMHCQHALASELQYPPCVQHSVGAGFQKLQLAGQQTAAAAAAADVAVSEPAAVDQASAEVPVAVETEPVRTAVR